ncbi:hypothetical protein CEXT_471651 [Caerostris extrusa]|uniref:C2H2-type domain-containing protein n=1 Tax=Caerostris extrusa TaxID=172846 RepID=A0AAV4NET1_CAEEX|nr:hypothetical protein CEXT_471651 [Caerostris extrusa]
MTAIIACIENNSQSYINWSSRAILKNRYVGRLKSSPIVSCNEIQSTFHNSRITTTKNKHISECFVCSKTFFNNSNLKRHMEIHCSQRKSYVCPVCEKKGSIGKLISTSLLI